MAKRTSPAPKSKDYEEVRELEVQEKFMSVREDMVNSLIEREDEVDMVLTGLLCGENPLLVGPPGTAKSLLLDTLMRWLGPDAQKFSILFGKYTTPEEVFGPISVQGLKNDEYRRITTGKLPQAHAAFADEIFKASTAILNTMLRVLNERVFENGDGVFRKVPLLICVAASNEWPSDQEGGKELGALFDRFLLRKTVRPIATRTGRDRLLWEVNHEPKLTSTITVEEINEARMEARHLPWTENAKTGLVEILDTLSAVGIRPGDRRQYKSVNACRAYAYLRGASEVEREHLEVLAHTLWEDPAEQADACAKVVAKIANPIGAQVLDKMMQIRDISANTSPAEAVPKLQVIIDELLTIPQVGSRAERVKAALRIARSELKLAYNKVIGVQEPA